MKSIEGVEPTVVYSVGEWLAEAELDPEGYRDRQLGVIDIRGEIRCYEFHSLTIEKTAKATFAAAMKLGGGEAGRKVPVQVYHADGRNWRVLVEYELHLKVSGLRGLGS